MWNTLINYIVSTTNNCAMLYWFAWYITWFISYREVWLQFYR